MTVLRLKATRSLLHNSKDGQTDRQIRTNRLIVSLYLDLQGFRTNWKHVNNCEELFILPTISTFQTCNVYCLSATIWSWSTSVVFCFYVSTFERIFDISMSLCRNKLFFVIWNTVFPLRVPFILVYWWHFCFKCQSYITYGVGETWGQSTEISLPCHLGIWYRIDVYHS